MADGALNHSRADLAVSVTRVAGPGGGTAHKPVGLVHFGAVRRGNASVHRERRLGDLGRSAIRLASVAEAFALIRSLL
jgi:nicotinamide-nucleotide amidase